MKKDSIQSRIEIFEEIERGKLSLEEAVRKLRRSIGKTQPEFAKLVKIAPRIVIDLERGKANPTLKTLRKIAESFGLEVGFRRKKS